MAYTLADLFNQMALFGPIVLLVIIYYVLLELFSKVFRKPEWEAQLSVEFTELIFSLLIIFFTFGFFVAGDVISNSIAGGDHFEVASSFLARCFYDGVREALYDVYTIQFFFSAYNTFYMRNADAVWTYTFKLYPGADAIVSITNILIFGLVAAYGSIYAQIIILAVSKAITFTFLLPAGLILRFLPPTRQAGTFLIALALAFQIVFPLTYVFHQKILDRITEIEEGNPRFDPYGMNVFEKYGFLFYPLLGASIGTSALGMVLNRFGSNLLTNLIIGVASSMGMYLFTFDIFKPILVDLAMLLLVSVFLPAFSILLTISFINSLFKFLSGGI